MSAEGSIKIKARELEKNVILFIRLETVNYESWNIKLLKINIVFFFERISLCSYIFGPSSRILAKPVYFIYLR